MNKRFAVITITAAVLLAGCQSRSGQLIDEALGHSEAHAAVIFRDISGHWAQSSIETAVAKGYVDGYEDGTFKPELNVTRAEFIKMAVTAIKLSVSKAAAGDPWYTPYVSAAVNAGIYRSGDFTSGDLNTPISRLEMSRIAVRATTKSLQNPAMHMDDLSFMYNAAKTGLIQGLDRGELAPDKATTRAQSVTIIERILTVISGGTLKTDKYAVGNAELALKKTNIFTVMPEFFGGVQTDEAHWNPSDLSMTTPDGLYSAQLDQLIAIDLEDPNDPNLSLLTDIHTLKWASLDGKSYPVDQSMHSYILYYKNTVNFNKDTTIYSNHSPNILLGIGGIEVPNVQDYLNGKLNSIASVIYYKIGDFPAYIIPKHGVQTLGNLSIAINAPTYSRDTAYSKVLLSVGVAKTIN